MRTARMLLVGPVLSMVAFASVAGAEEKAATPVAAARAPVATTPASAPAPLITAPVKIVLRAPRPQAATEVSKIAASRPLAELRQPLLDRVEKVVEKAPF